MMVFHTYPWGYDYHEGAAGDTCFLAGLLNTA